MIRFEMASVEAPPNPVAADVRRLTFINFMLRASLRRLLRGGGSRKSPKRFGIVAQSFLSSGSAATAKGRGRVAIASLLTTLLPFTSPAAAPKDMPVFRTTVFESGRDGYHTYRIPALITTQKSSLLAFCEGRKTGAGDHGDIDLVLRRSDDNGNTWSPQEIVFEEGGPAKITIGNPCPVVDADTGTIWLPFCRDNDGVFITHSRDDGKTWAKPIEITSTVKVKDWDWYATGPGHGIQIQRGKHKGRLVIPCDHRVKDKKGSWNERGRSHIFYSDDHGKSWKLGGSTDWSMNECEVVELSDGRLLLSMRNYRGKKQRAFAVSDDGGTTWSHPENHPQVHCPTCQSSIHRHAWAENLILYSGPGGPSRSHLTVRASFDDGKSWPLSRELFAGPSAYSDIAILSNGEVACLFEGGSKQYREGIQFARFHVNWLIRQPWTSPPPDSRAEYGHGIMPEDAQDGWLSLFDGATTYGWNGGTIARGVLSGPAISKVVFTESELRGEVVRAGHLRVGNGIYALNKGPFTLRINTADTRPVTLDDEIALKELAIRPVRLQTAFNGTNLSNWKIIPNPHNPKVKADWRLKDGLLHVTDGPSALEWKDQHDNVVIQIEARTGKLSNGGLFFRSIPGDFMNGYEAQLFNSCYDQNPAKPVRYSTGAIDDRQMARRLVSRDGEWFTMVVIAHGQQIATWVNGYQQTLLNDTRAPHDNPRRGLRIGAGTIQIQAHDPETDFEIRSVRIGEILRFH